MLPRPEILSSEILALEIAADPLGTPQEVTFLGAGAATVIPVLSGVATTQAASQGSAAVTFGGQGVALTAAQADGVATVQWHVAAAEHTTFSASGVAAVVAQPGYARETAFAAAGVATVAFEAVDEPGFDIVGVATVEFFSDAVADVVTEIEGASDGNFDAVGVARTRTDIDGVAQVAPDIQAVNGTRIDSENGSAVQFHGHSFAGADAEAAGVGALTGRTQALRGVAFEAQGEAQAEFGTDPLVRTWTVATLAGGCQVAFHTNALVRVATDFDAQGQSSGAFQLQALTWMRGDARGMSDVIFRRGREVQPFLVPSLDAVERPEENRAVDWS